MDDNKENEAKKKFYKVVGRNIKKYRDAMGLSQDALAEKMGLTKKTISRYELGEHRFDMGRITQAAEALGIEKKKLLKGTEAYLGLEPIETNIINMPILGFVPAGGPIMAEENIVDYIQFPKILVKSENDFCLKIHGDSMEDVGIDDGDLVLVHPQPVAENGQTVIARIDGEVTCKRFYRMNSKCKLEPANKKYKSIDCDDVEIIGVVKRIIKEIF